MPRGACQMIGAEAGAAHAMAHVIEAGVTRFSKRSGMKGGAKP